MLNTFANMITDNVFLAITLSFVAGLISSFTPCTLAQIPLIIGYVGGYTDNDKKKPLIYSLCFALGITITFTTFGLIASFLGKTVGIKSDVWYLLLAFLMFIIALQIIEVINIIPKKSKIYNGKKGIFGALMLGMFGGIFSSPCSTPVLIVILAYVADKSNILLGIIMLFLYSIGHSLLVVIAGTSVGFTQRMVQSNKVKNTANIIKYLLSILITALGIYMLSLVF